MRSRILAKLAGSRSRVWRRGLVVVLCAEYKSCRVQATSLVRAFYMLVKITLVVFIDTRWNEREEGEAYTLFDGTPSEQVGRVSAVRCQRRNWYTLQVKEHRLR